MQIGEKTVLTIKGEERSSGEGAQRKCPNGGHTPEKKI